MIGEREDAEHPPQPASTGAEYLEMVEEQGRLAHGQSDAQRRAAIAAATEYMATKTQSELNKKSGGGFTWNRK